MSTERIIVHKSLMETFKPALKRHLDNMYGPAGPSPVLISTPGASKAKKLVDDALAKGATLVHGPEDPNMKESTTTRMRPFIVGDVTKDMDLYYTESFGPSVSLFEVGSEEEAVTLANDTEYGLSAAVFSEDLRKALRVAKQVESGAVHINAMTGKSTLLKRT